MKKNVQIQVDGYTRVILTVIAGLLTLIAVGLWADADPMTGHASAQQTQKFSKQGEAAVEQGRWGSASAMNKVAATQDETNARLDTLIDLFRTGKAKVELIETNKSGDDHVSFQK